MTIRPIVEIIQEGPLRVVEVLVAGIPVIGAGATNLSITNRTATALTVASDTGSDAVLPLANATQAGLESAADKTKLDGIAADATANSSDATLLNRANHTGTQAAGTITGLATVATTGAYADLSGRPTLGTSAPLDVAATGDASTSQVVKGNDTRLSDARTPTTHNQAASTITGLATVATTGAYADLSGTPTLGTAAAAATTDFASAAQGVTNGNTHDHSGGDGAQIAYSSLSGLPILNSSDATLLNRANHTGTQAVDTITGLGSLATQNGTFSGTSSGTNTGDQTTISGNAGTATKLATPRAINGVDFDGSAAITVTAAAGTLTGTTLASGVTTSSLTSFGTAIALGTPSSGTLTNCTGLPAAGVTGIMPTANGGTGVDNSTGGTANQFWARPNGATGAATYRAIVAADIPTLNQNTTGSAATLATTRTIGGSDFDGSANITSFPAPGAIGGTTPAAGTFTTLVVGSTTSLLLGTAGTAIGNIGFRNATSGTITVAPQTGALGTVTLTLPAITDTVAVIAAPQTFTNKTLGNLKETVFTITDAAGFVIDPNNGPIQVVTLGANRTPVVANFGAGQSMMLAVDDGTGFSIDFASVGTFLDGAVAPVLYSTGYTLFELFVISSVVNIVWVPGKAL